MCEVYESIQYASFFTGSSPLLMNSISMVSLEDVWGRINGSRLEFGSMTWYSAHWVLYVSSSFPPPLVTIPRLGGAGDHQPLPRQPGSSSTWRGPHDNLWLPANLIITAALLAHRRLLRLLPAHRFPQESALVSLQLSFTPGSSWSWTWVLKWCLLGDPRSPLFPSTCSSIRLSHSRRGAV